MEYWLQILAAVVFAGVGFSAATYAIVRLVDRSRLADAQSRAKEILQRAELDADVKRRDAELHVKEQAIQLKEQNEKKLSQMRHEFHERERALDKRQDGIEKQVEDLRKQERIVENTQRKFQEKTEDVNRRTAELEKLITMQRQSLHDISCLNQNEAKDMLMATLEKELAEEMGTVIIRHERKMGEECDQLARNVLLMSLQRYAAAHTAEATTTTIDIPSDEMKGRIIGREGRNIRAFEKATGIDVIIDDTPGVVIVSGFDPIRREVAKLSLNRLIADGRIHPSRIEEIVAETAAEVNSFVHKAGVKACQEVELHGLHDRIVNQLGRLHFRTSYSQNVLRHCVEVAFISGMIAVELGMNEKMARRCGLLHDIGKAMDHEMEGGHPKIGADFLKRCGEPFEVIQAALGHHDDPRYDNPYTVIVAAADACSAARPGARRETLEHYAKRMDELEAIASSFDGVEQAYAVQAGRELRVMVNAVKTTDESAAKICRDIVKTLKEQVQYPGEIKVSLIRECRFVEIAE